MEIKVGQTFKHNKYNEIFKVINILDCENVLYLTEILVRSDSVYWAKHMNQPYASKGFIENYCTLYPQASTKLWQVLNL